MTLDEILARHPRPWRAAGAVVLDRDGDIVFAFGDGNAALARLLAAAPAQEIERMAARAKVPQRTSWPLDPCRCGGRLSVRHGTERLDLKRDELRVEAECDDCGSTYVVVSSWDVATHLEADPDKETLDDDLAPVAVAAKRDAEKGDRLEDV